jgi:Fic family protein
LNWYEKHKNKYPPLLLAALVHNEFENIHPFQDGNGRVGRLLLNYVLLKHNYPPINIKLEDRQKYYEALQDYQKRGEIISTLRFLISQVTTKKKMWSPINEM